MNKIKNETLPSKPSSNMYLTNFPGLQGHPIPNSEPTPTSSVYPQHTISSLAPLTNTDDTSSHKPASEDQGANRLLDEPTGKRTTEAIRDQKLKTEDAQATGAPVDTLHKEAITQPGNQVGKPFGTNLEGTNSGEEYLRSTSLTAEGDNLDATKPGDGQKADRKSSLSSSLLSLGFLIVETESGLHGGSGTPANTSDASPEADLVDSTKKMKLTDKIKGKLHIGKKSSSG